MTTAKLTSEDAKWNCTQNNETEPTYRQGKKGIMIKQLLAKQEG